MNSTMIRKRSLLKRAFVMVLYCFCIKSKCSLQKYDKIKLYVKYNMLSQRFVIIRYSCSKCTISNFYSLYQLKNDVVSCLIKQTFAILLSTSISADLFQLYCHLHTNLVFRLFLVSKNLSH